MTFGPHPGQLGEVDPAVVARVLEAAGQRVTEINRTTRDGLAEVISQGIDQGMGAAELGRAIESWSGWDEYRAEMIARTETGIAYNEAALASYADAGVEQVHVTDGDGDDECAPWSDWTGPIDEAPEPLGHPNCTRDIEPVVGYTAEDYQTAADFLGGG